MRGAEGRDSVGDVRREVPVGRGCFCDIRRRRIGADTPALCPHERVQQRAS